jgi:putative spermidine/putrescine transport system permease protein
MRRSGSTAALLAPSGLVYVLLLVAPLVFLFRTSLFPPGPGAPLEGPATVAAYGELIDGYFLAILGRTLRIALFTTAICLALGYPLALSIASARGTRRAVLTLLVVSPLFVSVVVRAYGWILLLGNRGLVNEALLGLGLIDAPLRLLYSEGAVVAALVEALLPFMAISIVSVLDRVEPELDRAARGLGATPFQTFLHVTLPLSTPGALAGGLLVFLVSMGAYATPALIGGSRVRVTVTEIATQVTTVFNWPLAAALSIVLLLVSLIIVGSMTRFVARSS